MNQYVAPVVLALALLLSGCGLTAETQAVRQAVAEYGAKIADAELENIEWTLCRGISVGAFTRRYGQNQRKAAAWRELCSTEAVSP